MDTDKSKHIEFVEFFKWFGKTKNQHKSIDNRASQQRGADPLTGMKKKGVGRSVTKSGLFEQPKMINDAKNY